MPTLIPVRLYTEVISAFYRLRGIIMPGGLYAKLHQWRHNELHGSGETWIAFTRSTQLKDRYEWEHNVGGKVLESTQAQTENELWLTDTTYKRVGIYICIVYGVLQRRRVHLMWHPLGYNDRIPIIDSSTALLSGYLNRYKIVNLKTNIKYSNKSNGGVPIPHKV